MLVVTTCTGGYAKPWVFPTLGFLACRVVALLDKSDSRPLPRFVERHPYQCPGTLYQDGRFLDAVPDVRDDEVVVLADADGVFQRDFNRAELDTLADIGDGVALGYNMRPGQQGEEEYRELRPLQSLEQAAQTLGIAPDVMRRAWVYNTGFMAARAATWQRLRYLFAETFSGHGPDLFCLHSWPQYFLCLLFSLHGIPVTELGFETHSHGHFPLTQLHCIDKRQLWYDGRRVLFTHSVPGVSH